MSARLYLIRHPHTRPDPAAPAATWGLSDTGRAQVEALARAAWWPAVTGLYTSDQYKTRVVGEAVHAAHGIPWTVISGLDEAQRDTWLDPEAFQDAQRAFFAQPDAPPIPEWESAHAAQARFGAAMADILARHPAGESLAVVSHATVLTFYAAGLRGERSSFALWQTIGFAAVMVVDRATLRPLSPFVTAPYGGIEAL